jgi:shikimate dehydrogenase
MRDSFNSNTVLTGLIGHPIKQSFSPFIQNVAFEFKNMDYLYLPFDIPPANLKNALSGSVALGIRGFNVTIPHKERIIEFLDSLSEEATMIGAVNTVVNDHGKLIGYNTDVTGVIETLLPFKDEIAGSIVTVVGSGGGARAVIYALIRHFKPMEINVINRTEERALALQNYFATKMKFDAFKYFELFPPDNVNILKSSKLIINTTSVGMYPEINDTITELDDSFNNKQIVFDIIYNPPQSKLLRIAEKNGATCLGGVRMFIKQAAKAFELWTGEQMPVDEVSKSLELYMSK